MKKQFGVVCLLGLSQLTAQPTHMPYYPLTPVSGAQVTLTDHFWQPKRELAFTEAFDWVTYNFDKTGGGYKTFRESSRRDTIQVKPVTSFESIKVLEAVGEYLKSCKDPVMEAYMDRCIDHWILHQDKSGYFAGICPGDGNGKGRWNFLQWSHELYGVGHLLEAAQSYAQTTGKEKILNAARRATDQVFTLFGPDKRHDVPGHEEIERAFTRYYEATGEKRYLDLAKFFIDQRGDHTLRESYGDYAQDHLPFIDQRRVYGHAVRGTYLYIGATDVVGACGDESYRTALDSIWNSMIHQHMYNTGATGVMHSGIEGYAAPYDIAPDDTYGETCGAIANSIWAHRLNRLYGDASYMDQFEKIIYNTFLSSLAMNGHGIYYCNKVNNPAPEQRNWPNCPCCPGNLLTHYARIPEYIYSQSAEGIYVNLFISNTANIPLGGGVKLSQTTEYPWDGKITLTVDPTTEKSFKLFVRIPQWTQSHTIKINGKTATVPVEKGYAILEKRWVPGDRVEIDLPMTAKRTYMDSHFTHYKGLVALQRGPIIYTFEGIDNEGAVCNLQLPAQATLKCTSNDQLGGIVQIEAQGRVLGWDGEWSHRKITAIPCGLHSNRGTSVHYVWIAEDPDRVQPPTHHLNTLFPPA